MTLDLHLGHVGQNETYPPQFIPCVGISLKLTIYNPLYGGDVYLHEPLNKPKISLSTCDSNSLALPPEINVYILGWGIPPLCPASTRTPNRRTSTEFCGTLSTPWCPKLTTSTLVSRPGRKLGPREFRDQDKREMRMVNLRTR